jgi:DNA-binding transcriptional LysR family regulator
VPTSNASGWQASEARIDGLRGTGTIGANLCTMKSVNIMDYRGRAPEPEPTLTGTMHLRYIEMFQAILQAGTLTDAAYLLNISQPAATKLLQQAERRLGFPLFVRAKGRLHPTPESELLKGHIEQIFAQLCDLQMLVSNIGRAENRLLRVISTPTLATAVVPRAIARLRRLLGKTTIELATQHSREMFKSIVLRESDLGFTLQESTHPDVRCEPLCSGSLAVIAPRGTWTGREATLPMPVEALADANLVGISTADNLGRQLQSYVEQLSPPPRVSIWVQTYQIARDLVSNGEGLALVDPFIAASSGPNIQTRPVEPAVPITLYAAYRIDRPLNSAQRCFLQCVREAAAESLATLVAPVQRTGTA